MAETMQFDLVSPEKRLASMEVTEVRIPGTEGDLTAMASHEATVVTMRPGVLTVVGPQGEQRYAVTGGFAEISDAGVTVLAERAHGDGDLSQEQFDGYVAEARQAQETAQASVQDGGEPGIVDDAVKLLADMEALGTHMGLSTTSRVAAPG